MEKMGLFILASDDINLLLKKFWRIIKDRIRLKKGSDS
jgi:hypothetical protein